MNIVFFGSSNFSVNFLDSILSSGQKVQAVATRPDKPKGRHLILSPTPVKELAVKNNLKLFQPEDVNANDSIDFLSSLKPDLFVVVAYGEILSHKILEIPRIFSVNVHASLLPKYRGAAPINWALINGEKLSGITIIKMIEELDAGPVVLQKIIPIDDDDNAYTLEEKLSRHGAHSLLEALEKIKNNNFSLIAQNDAEVSFAPKLNKKAGFITWSQSATGIRNLIRGCMGWPDAFTYFKGKQLKIFKVSVVPFDANKYHPGEVVSAGKEGLLVATGKDCVLIEELQIEGRRRMSAEEFLTGHKIYSGDKMGYPLASS
jgi:methionyl-tRNA formyltransferase